MADGVGIIDLSEARRKARGSSARSTGLSDPVDPVRWAAELGLPEWVPLTIGVITDELDDPGITGRLQMLAKRGEATMVSSSWECLHALLARTTLAWTLDQIAASGGRVDPKVVSMARDIIVRLDDAADLNTPDLDSFLDVYDDISDLGFEHGLNGALQRTTAHAWNVVYWSPDEPHAGLPSAVAAAWGAARHFGKVSLGTLSLQTVWGAARHKLLGSKVPPATLAHAIAKVMAREVAEYEKC